MLLVTPRYAPLTGGVETHVREVAHRLASRGFDVTVLTTDLAETLPRLEIDRGVTVQRVRAYPQSRDYYWSPAVYRIAVKPGWDIIHCQGIHTFVPPLTMLAAIRSDTPFFVTFHSGGHSSRLRNRARRIQWLALAPLMRRARRLIAVSDFEKQLFSAVPGISRKQIDVIPNGADLPSFLDGPVHVDDGLIVSLGRLERYKGHHHAIRALPWLAQRLPNARLRVVGSGPYAAALEEEAKSHGVADRVSIGPVDSTDRGAMARLLRSAAAVVLFSEYEAHAIAVIEAIALGRPVVVSDSTGLRDLVKAGLARGVSPQATPAEVAEAIFTEIVSPTPRTAQVLTWDDAVDRLGNLYAAALR